MLYNLIRRFDCSIVSGSWSTDSIEDIEKAFETEGITLNLKSIPTDKEQFIRLDDKVFVYWLDSMLNSTWFKCDLMSIDDFEPEFVANGFVELEEEE